MVKCCWLVLVLVGVGLVGGCLVGCVCGGGGLEYLPTNSGLNYPTKS